MVTKSKATTFIILLFACIYFFQGTSICQAATIKQSKSKDALTFHEYGDYGAIIYTTAEVCLVATERYTKSNNTATYADRETYFYLKTILGDKNSIGYQLTPIRHYNSSGNIAKSFSWKTTSGLFPACDYCKDVSNKTKVSYSTSTSNYAKASVVISVAGSFEKYMARTVKIYLKV